MHPPPDRERPVGTIQLLALGVNGIVGVGIFFIPASVAASAPGHGAVAVFALTGLALLPAALTFATLGRRFDEDGGPVVFARAAFGDRVSFLVGWVAYVSALFSTAAVSVGLTRAALPALGVQGGLAARAAPALLVTLLAAVVASGLRLSARVWTALTALKLLPLVLLVLVFALAWARLPAPAASVPGPGWLRASLTVVFAYQGFEIVPVLAGQVRSSSRAVPFATLGSLALAIGLYVALVVACVTALPGLASSAAPLADAAGVLGGGAFAGLVAAGTSVSALGIAFGMMVATPRYLSALAAGERRLFDLDRASGAGVPTRALGVTWAIVATVVSLGELGELFALSSIAVLAQFATSGLALVVLGARRERGLEPRHAWPAVPTLAVAAVLVVAGASRREALVAAGALVLGLGLMRLARSR
ncbi:MAG TPA: APC family permease [Vicinamibacteria bacterium]|nr:APC family permease [Vicinamibacteria bacterium]